MNFKKVPIKDAFVIEPEPVKDSRGMFARLFCKEEFQKIGHQKSIAQINHSLNVKKGSLRGMHFQRKPKVEIKFVKCIRGSVYDVIVDIRKASPTLLKWHGEILSEKNMRMIYIPEGCAHGFQTLETNSELIYFHTQFYDPEYEGALHYDDPLIKIEWPMDVKEISDRDRHHPFLQSDFTGLEF
jgi:dTDP-4-dehydrorhamnose 3,5-epimerase